MKHAGIDMGTRFVKMAVFDDYGYDLKKCDTVEFYKKYIIAHDDCFSLDLEKLGLSGFEICATGYGREMANLSGIKKISEISAHTKGAIIQTGLESFILIDLGGQDSKIIDVENSMVKDFAANDRCAASTGRYLENMANILGMTIEEMALFYDNPVKLSSVCAVFGESELLSKIAIGKEVGELAAGVNYALYNRLSPIIKRFMPKNIVLAGGVSKSIAIKKIIARDLDIEPILLRFPQYNGAIGALCQILDNNLLHSLINRIQL